MTGERCEPVGEGTIRGLWTSAATRRRAARPARHPFGSLVTTPRLVAAYRVDVEPCQRFPVPASVLAGEGSVPLGVGLLVLLGAAGALIACRRLVTVG